MSSSGGSQAASFRPEDVARWETLENDRHRFLESGYMYNGRPMSEGHAKFLASRSPVPALGWGSGIEGNREVAIGGGTQKMICNTPPEQVGIGGERWAQVINPYSGTLHDVRVTVDTGTTVNWILPRLVKEYDLVPTRTSDVSIFQDFRGNEFQCDSFVDVTWIGQSEKSRRTRFCIAPVGSPIELAVCEDFIKEYGVDSLFREKPTKPVLVMAQKKMTDAEKAEIERRAVEADNHSAAIAKKMEEKKARRKESRATPRQPKGGPEGGQKPGSDK